MKFSSWKVSLFAVVFILAMLVMPLMPGSASAAGLPTSPPGLGDFSPGKVVQMTKDYVVGHFNNLPEYGHTYWSFDPNGTITVTDDFGNSLTLRVPLADIGSSKGVKPALQLFQNKGKNQVYYSYTSSVANYRVVYDFSSKPDSVEITTVGNAVASGEINIPLELKGKSRTESTSTSVSAVAVDSKGKELGRLSYDWSDAPVECSGSAPAFAKFKVGTSFNIDPSVVGTSTAPGASSAAFSRGTFYAKNLHWVFYYDGTNFVYRTSSDATSWSASTIVHAGAAIFNYSVSYDGTYACYSIVDVSTAYFRRFVPNSDGTVTYSAAEQTVATGVASSYTSVSLDSSNNPWVTYGVISGVSRISYLSKSSTTDGTWSTASGFPKQLSSNAAGECVVPLNSGKMLAVYSSGANIYSQLWNGSSLGSQRTVTSTSAGVLFAVVTTGDTAYLTWENNPGLYVKLGTYSASTDLWDSGTTVSTTAINGNLGLAIDSSNNLYAFFATSTPNIYYRKRVSTTWDASDTLLTAPGAAVWTLSSTEYAWGGVVGVIYTTGAGAPYDVNYATLTSTMVPAVDTLAATGVGTTTVTMNGNLTNTGGGTVTKEGFDYNTTDDFTSAFEIVYTNTTYSVGPFSCSTIQFSPGTTWYYRAKAYSATGWGYGESVSFTLGSVNGTIETQAANPIAQNSATLNAYISSDGGLTCTVEFEWGSTSGGPYPSNSGWYGSYNVGAHPQYVISGLTPGSLYYFRARLQNANGIYDGDELSFVASSTIYSPPTLIAIPRSNSEISIKWTPGPGSSSTSLRYKEGAPPTDPYDGTLAYSGTANSYILTGLSSGTTYGVSAWGFDSGNYSTTYLSDTATTFAGEAAANGIVGNGTPGSYFQTPGYTKLSNLPFYDLFNHIADSWNMSRAAFWMLMAAFLSVILGVLAGYYSQEPLLAVAVVGFSLAGATASGVFPGWFILIFLLLAGGAVTAFSTK